jgi:hypothetical protein
MNPRVDVPVTLHIVDCIPIGNVVLSQAEPGPIYAGLAVDLLADIVPNTAFMPYDYTIDYGDGTAPVSGTSSDDPLAFSHTFAEPGEYTISFSAQNECMADPVVVTLTVVVEESPTFHFYLPFILKGYQP